jgi:RNA polymerase sigma-70 factor (ECF subfamily)
VDTDAIDAARRGDRQAQGLLLRQLQDPWYRMCVSLLGDPERARDATQETALRFLRQLPTFRGQSKLTTWSMGIAINVVREMRRARGGAISDDGRIADDQLAGGDGPDQAAALHEEREGLRALLADLPQRQREAVVLRFFEEMSVEETAALMGCAPGTVKATIHQALRALKRKLGQLI